MHAGIENLVPDALSSSQIGELMLVVSAALVPIAIAVVFGMKVMGKVLLTVKLTRIWDQRL